MIDEIGTLPGEVLVMITVSLYSPIAGPYLDIRKRDLSDWTLPA